MLLLRSCFLLTNAPIPRSVLMNPLDGKVALITGASEGIGAALALALKSRGVRLSLVARRDKELRQIGGPEAAITSGDITYHGVRESALNNTMARFGRLDFLINNAGRGLYQSVSTTSIDDAKRLLDLNFFAPIALAQLATPMLRATRGMIVNVSSIAGQLPLPWLPAYSASKAALESITAAQRMELKASGVHAMCVCPGYVYTGFHDHAEGKRPPQAIVKGKRFAISAEACAAAIAEGMAKRKRTVVVPRAGWVLVWLYRFFPHLVESRLGKV